MKFYGAAKEAIVPQNCELTGYDNFLASTDISEFNTGVL
jgi:hypothetical protein